MGHSSDANTEVIIISFLTFPYKPSFLCKTQMTSASVFVVVHLGHTKVEDYKKDPDF